MTFGYKDTQAAMHAYTGTLQGLKLGQSIFAQLNWEFAKMLLEVFKRLFATNSLDRQEEFARDLANFSEDMQRKYGTTSPFGWSPRSPMEKKLGISHSEYKTESNRYKEYAPDGFDFDDFTY